MKVRIHATAVAPFVLPDQRGSGRTPALARPSIAGAWALLGPAQVPGVMG